MKQPLVPEGDVSNEVIPSAISPIVVDVVSDDIIPNTQHIPDAQVILDHLDIPKEIKISC